MKRRDFIATVVLGQAGCVSHTQPPLARAAAYLWKQQAADGGWHSHTYGLLRSGQSLTPFVLDALLQIPQHFFPVPHGKLDRALAFIRARIQPNGALGLADADFADYPNYATALAISALSHVGGGRSEIACMVDYLRGQQFTEQNGWRPGDPAYGAWGMGGARRTPPDTGHVDLSMTRHVLDALHAARVPATDPVFAAARIFVQRCQNADPDGGFFFTTTEFDTNKAGHDGKQFRSYGTATADGILALVATSQRLGDPRIESARRWLTEHHRNIYVPGFTGEAYDRWPRGLSFYYSAAIAKAWQSLKQGSPPNVAKNLTEQQKPEGHWSNPENLVKEDDPLIATSFAIQALALS
jgi:hypothetical protein